MPINFLSLLHDIRIIRRRFRSFGGMRLVALYIKWGLLWTIIKSTLICIVKRRSLKYVYGSILRHVEVRLFNQYSSLIGSAIDRVNSEVATDTDITTPNPDDKTKVWWCWLQGYDKAPDIVKFCHASLQKGLRNAEINIVTFDNFGQWVELPENIINRYRQGVIPPALFSDILRLALLIRHGGVWIDSTVFYSLEDSDTDTGTKYTPSWADIRNADLFLMQYTRPGEQWSGSTSNWFISARPGNKVLRVLYEVLIAYWSDYDCTVDYYIFHYFIDVILRRFPELIEQMPYGWSTACIQLVRQLDKPYDVVKTAKILTFSNWHKLAYNLNKQAYTKPESTYRSWPEGPGAQAP